MILGSKNSNQGSDGDVGDKAPGIVDGPAIGCSGSREAYFSLGISSRPGEQWLEGGDAASGLCSVSALFWSRCSL
jgi:hypothetical protein